MKTAPSKTVDDYISQFPAETARKLQQLRKAVQRAAANAEETISYGMPAYRYKNRVVFYFAGYNKHIGVYATPSGHAAFQAELAGYKQGRGSVQFPIDKPLPLELIGKMVRFKVAQRDAEAGDAFALLSAPARRALQGNGISSLKQLSRLTEAEVLQLHGIGKTTIPVLRNLLKDNGLAFKKSS